MTRKLVFLANVIVIAGFLFVGCSSGAQQQNSTTGTVQQTSPASTVQEASNNGSSSTNAGTTTAAPTTGEKTFTAAELSKFDGQNGNPAYVAVHGVVYDLSNIRQWNGGKHNGLTAGKDLTKEFDTISPHDLSIFDNIPKVGKYVG